MTQTSLDIVTAPLVQPGQALESSRDAGYDLPAAVGEPVDNSIQADASIVRIWTDVVEEGKSKRIARIAFADDGHGIPHETLASVLSLGFGTRYNDRTGLGRFGMGLKLATLSQARRADIYTRPAGSTQLFHTYIDLDEIKDGVQEELAAREVDAFPDDLAHLMTDPRKKKTFQSGTLIVWSKVDRIESGGRFGAAIDERLQELVRFLGRSYRTFIAAGLYIELNNREVFLHDPLFLLDNPRVAKKFDGVRATVLANDEIEIDNEKVSVRVTLLPERFRHKRGVGAAGAEFKDLYIPDNERRVSILREGREIYYDVIPKLFPSDRLSGEDQDRFIGVEIGFPASLDEYFRVRNVKRGAEPDGKLRAEFRELVKKPIRAAREEIRRHWNETDRAEREAEHEHEAAQEAVARLEEKLPPGQAGQGAPPERKKEIIEDLVSDLKLEPEETERREQVKRDVETKPITLIDLDWPGKELLDITHLNGKAIVKINTRHPFIREVYRPLKDVARKAPGELEESEVIELARKAEVALDVLFMAYAWAENMNPDADVAYSDLRSYWGQFTAAFVTEALR